MKDLAPWAHEEADSCIFVHVRHAELNSSKALMIKANDTDVVVIAISVMRSLNELGLEKCRLHLAKEEIFNGSSARSSQHNRSRESQWTPILSRIHWMRHCVCFPWQREDVCVANMER